jgi:hypothetical protein
MEATAGDGHGEDREGAWQRRRDDLRARAARARGTCREGKCIFGLNDTLGANQAAMSADDRNDGLGARRCSRSPERHRRPPGPLLGSTHQLL